MKSVKDITITQGRAKKSFENVFNNLIMGKITDKIDKTVEKERIRTGVITKFYPYLDKAEVKLDNLDKKVLCKILHRYGGDIIDFYTPLENEQIFDDNLKEPAIIPRSNQHVCVLQIHDADSTENLILGYYNNEEVVGYDPAQPGNLKFMSLTESNLYWIKFGRDGLEFRLPSQPEFVSGDLDSDMEEINYADSENVYTKDEVYTKAEVDELIAEKIAEALESLDEEE